MKQILVRHGESRELGKIFQVSQVSVRRALRGQNNSDLTKRIRTAAIKRGGVVAEFVSVNDCPTL